MRHMRLAVLAADVIKHFAAAAILEVRIDIRQGYTVGVEETLKKEVVLERIQIGNLQTVSHYRTCRTTTTRTDGDVQLLTRCTDEIHDDEEVTRETHRDDGVELELDTLFQFLVVLQPLFAVTLFGAFHRQMPQVRALERQTVGVVFFRSLSSSSFCNRSSP